MVTALWEKSISRSEEFKPDHAYDNSQSHIGLTEGSNLINTDYIRVNSRENYRSESYDYRMEYEKSLYDNH